MTSTADISKWIASLPPGTDVFEALKTTITEAVGNPMLTGAKKIVFWVLVGVHALVVLLALSGISIKYKRGGGWLFTRDAGNGFWRPSASIVPQALFAVYGVFFLITVPTCVLVRQPSYGAYLFSVLSYIPIGLAFHATVWSTLGVSLSTSSPIAVGSPSSKRHRLPAYIGFWTALLFVLCHAPVIAAVQIFRRRQQHALYELLEGIDEAAASGLGLVALAGMEPLYNDLMKLSWKLFTLYRVEVGVYGVWAIVWMLVYVPTSLHLFTTLRIRARRLGRSIKSLRVLDELVTHDDLEAGVYEETEKESIDPNSLSFSFARTPRLDTGAPRLPPLALSPLHSPLSPEISSFSSPVSSPRSDTTIRGPASPRSEATFDAWTIGRRGTSTTGAVAMRSGSRIAEMQADLAKVKRTLATIVMQFIVSCAMVFSFLPFCFLITSGNAHLVTGGAYQIWIGWTFAAPALVSSAVFLFFAVVGPSPSPPTPSTPTSPSTAAAISPLPLMAEFAPASPSPPPPPSMTNPAHPSAPTRHMPRSPLSSRRLARALRDFFEWPTNPLIRGSESEPSTSSTADSRSFSRSRHGSTSTARPASPPEPLLPPPTAFFGRGKGKGRSNSRPNTAESLVDSASATTRRVPASKGHKSKSSSSSGTSAAMGPGFKELAATEEKETEQQQGRVPVQGWVPSVWARGMRETEEQGRRKSEEEQAKREVERGE